MLPRNQHRDVIARVDGDSSSLLLPSWMGKGMARLQRSTPQYEKLPIGCKGIVSLISAGAEDDDLRK